MSQIKLDNLTPEQEALIPVYREKWRKIALSTEPLDSQKATDAVLSTYKVLKESLYGSEVKQEPKIIFLDSPYLALTTKEAIKTVQAHAEATIYDPEDEIYFFGAECATWNVNILCELEVTVEQELKEQLSRKLNKHLYRQLVLKLENQIMPVAIQIEKQLTQQLGTLSCQLNNSIQPERYVSHASYIDFCISVLHCSHNRLKWETFQSLLKHCGWIFPYREICFVCARPIKLSFDGENKLHAEGEPAIQFADGYSLYSCHGVTLPGNYIALPSHLLRKAWLVSAGNVMLRRTLIQRVSRGQLDEEREDIFMRLIEQTNSEIRRLGWNEETCRYALMELSGGKHGKKSRLICTNEELEKFLTYLQSQPTP